MDGTTDADGYATGVDYLCSDCGLVHHGPHTGLRFEHPEQVGGIDDEGRGYTGAEARAQGVPDNVSHGVCPECLDTRMALIREEYAHRQRMKRGRP